MSINWWGIMFFIVPILLGVVITAGITVIEILKMLWRLSK